MLAARDTVLQSGVFDRIADAVVAAASGVHADRPLRVADLGCGTGFYAARLDRALPGTAFLLGDRSPDAVRAAARAVPSGSPVVLDIWQPLPLRDESADVILNVFAPRNPGEFARILRPGGRAIVVVPRADHLGELRSEGTLLDIPPDKAAAVTDQLRVAGFEPASADHVRSRCEVDDALRTKFAAMGPSAHHAAALTGASSSSSAGDHLVVTVSVDVLTFVLPSR
ncbi:hypothetical protein GCM10025870_02320 [Agromyces marinus]|uniref:Methyltransferase domain-containing protein n=2 Tax=Agromyces marinus TaxID=1389020 RepID=A0ABM8GXH0_9MICO|nr:methyltransferase domain-containing protein [Agromyces marinus]BDZ53159.1 hypothetical protein GCM10025870_02320 [Agromyces marinus]